MAVLPGELAHRSGRAEPDPAAVGGQVWTARRGQADAGYVAYGPYAPLPPGRYLALFRLKRLDGGSGLVATVDACVGGGLPVRGSRAVSAKDLPPGRFREVPLVFQHPGGTVETRVLWAGKASLAIDNVTVWKITAARR